MAAASQNYLPTLSDDSVKAKTGKTWAQWFSLLNRAGAKELNHQAIVRELKHAPGLTGWWRQMIAVEYERAQGLRAKHQRADGFSVSISKTLKAELSELFDAAANATRRSQWFPQGDFEPSSQTPDRYLRGAWRKSLRVEMGFYAKGPGKSQLAIQVNRLPNASDVEKERQRWKAAITKLQRLLAS